MKPLKTTSLILTALLASGIFSARAQSTAFTYQGRLRDNAVPAVGVFDLRFALYADHSDGTQIGSFIYVEDVAVTNGLFCVVLDFGLSAFPGPARWLETSLRPGDETGAYTTLAPRRALTATPYAWYAPNAGTATTATIVPAVNLTGTVPLARLPEEVVTNNEAGLTLSGVFSGSGAGLISVNANLLDNQEGAFYQNAANLTAGIVPLARLPDEVVTNNELGLTLNGTFSGSGAGLISVDADLLDNQHGAFYQNAANLTTGIVPLARLPGEVVTNNEAGLTLNGTFSGNGAGLASVNADLLDNQHGAFYQNAANLNAGTLSDARLSTSATSAIDAAKGATSANVPDTIVKRDGSGNFAAGTVAGAFVGDGSGLTNISIDNIIGGGGQVSLPSGLTVVSTLPNDPALIASGYRMMMTVPAPPWVTSSASDAPSGRFGHTAIWDGQRLSIWGGRLMTGSSYLSSGGLYHADANRWQTLSTIGAPSPRWGHTAVWSGSEMLVWGGNGATGPTNTGGRFQPDGNLWKEISMTLTPSARTEHVALWTGSEMLIWGGQNASGLLNDGALYNPASDVWSAVTSDNAPAPRLGATAVWAGDRVLIWGGEGSGGTLGSGSQLINAGGTALWVPMNSVNAPAARRGHSAIWTGAKMIVWGGQSGGVPFRNGAAYDPATDSWQALPEAGAPGARFNHVAVWTGEEMLIVAGSNVTMEFASGAAYNPATGVWRPLSSSGPPLVRTEATGAWTGTEVLIFGGRAQGMPVDSLQRLNPQPVWYFYRKI